MDLFIIEIALAVGAIVSNLGTVLTLFTTNVMLQLLIGIMVTGVAIKHARRFIKTRA